MRIFALILGLAVFGLDVVTKRWVEHTAWLYHYPVIEGFFTIQYRRNEGIAFGLLHELQSEWKPVLLSLLALVAIVVVLYYIRVTPEDQRLSFVSLGLLLGGILGNFTDRLLNQYVVDFITLHWKNQFAWPTFNIADAAITCGVFLILYETFFWSRPEDSGGPGTAEPDSGKGTTPEATGGKVLGAGLLLPLLLLPSVPENPAQVAEKLQKKYESLRSFIAEFEQIFHSRSVELRESGVVMMEKPGRMYWEYRNPTRKFFVADGNRTYFYVPRDNQLVVSKLTPSASGSPLMFLLGSGDLRRDFTVEYAEEREEDPRAIRLKLTPRIPQAEFSYLILEVDTGSYLIRRLRIVEPIGNQNEYILYNLKENVRIPDRQFKLDVPSGVEVIEQ